MPQKKMIDRDNIPYRKMDKTIIEVKDCLQAELLLNEPLLPRQAHMLQSYCKFQIADNLKGITFSTQNSWKGLIMAFLSIAYSKYSCGFVKLIRNDTQYTITQVSYEYKELLCILDHTCPDDTDDRIEQIAAPPSWRPCYVIAKKGYTPMGIEKSLANFAKILDLDIKSSTFVTQYTNNIPHEYKCRPAEKRKVSQNFLNKLSPLHHELTYLEEISYVLPKQKIQMLWQCITNQVEGIAIINTSLMESLCGNRWLIVANDLLEVVNLPETVKIYDDPDHPAPFWGYAITSETIGYLCKKFPYLEAELRYFLHKCSTPPYVVFDKKYMGKWG